MSEYVDKKKVINRLPNKQTIELIRDIEPVDVVERAEYEKLCKEYEHYKRLIEQDNNLRSEINKALELTYKVREMVLHSNRTYEVNDVLDIIDEISACFERHIGE